MIGAVVALCLLAAAPVKIRIEVIEYDPGMKPVAGAKVTLRESEAADAGARELQATTDASGLAWFEVPHLGFEPVEIEKQGYVTRAEMKPFQKDLPKFESKQDRGPGEVYLRAYLYPRSKWKYELKAATREQATAIADEWGSECHAGPATSVEYHEVGATWLFQYPCLRVFVDAKTGATNLQVKKVVTSTPMYPPADALADALSSPLEFLARLQSDAHDIPQCAYRNKTVFVLDEYCTKKEIHSTGIKVIHPTRGTVHLYAEAKSAISTTPRDDWDSWHFETDDPYAGASIAMSWPEIERHEIRRRRFQEGRCWADLTSERGGACTDKAGDIPQWWQGVYPQLLKSPPETWFTLVRQLRGLARNNGKPDPRGPIQNPVLPPSEPVASGASNRITVELEQYYLMKPVVGAKVTLRDRTGKQADLVGVTNGRGKVRFDAPHLDFELASIDHPELLTAAELAPIKDLFQSIETRREPNGPGELKLEQLVVNRKWLAASLKVPTPEAAVKIANTWGRECGGVPVRVTRPSSWKVEYPCVVVHVDAWNGDEQDPTVQKLTPDTVSDQKLYPPDEALADALSSPLRHVGTGVWPGRYKIPSCAYRNDKVLVLDSYCTIREMNPTTVWIFHPERGIAVLSATGDRGALVSQVKRKDYEQWAFTALDPYPGLKLAMTFQELSDWEQRRGVFSRASCSATLVTSASNRGACNLKTPEIERWWQGYSRPLLEDPPPGWFELTRVLRKLAPKYGKKDPRYE